MDQVVAFEEETDAPARETVVLDLLQRRREPGVQCGEVGAGHPLIVAWPAAVSPARPVLPDTGTAPCRARSPVRPGALPPPAPRIRPAARSGGVRAVRDRRPAGSAGRVTSGGP